MEVEKTPIKAQLIDFGLAKNASTKDFGFCGTAEYIPPEGFAKPDIVPPYHAFDVYGIGVLYLQLLCPAARLS